MRKNAYLSRLKIDLERWRGAGWIDGALGDQLFADAEAHFHAQDRTSAVLPGLAAFVIAIGMLTIIASNWEALNGVVRLGLFFIIFAAATIGSGELRARGALMPANILATLAAALVGGGLVIIGQLYHSAATTSAFLSVWSVFAMIVALLLRAPLAASLAVALAAVWTGFHFVDTGRLAASGHLFYGPYWALAVWIAGAVFAVAIRSLALVHLIFIGVMVWITPTLVEIVEIVAASKSVRPLMIAGLWAGAASAFEFVARTQQIWATRTLAGWCAWTASAYLVIAAAVERLDPKLFGAFGLAVLALTAFTALAAYGAAPGRRWFRGAGIAGFIAASVIFFTAADNLFVSGLIMVGFGLGLVALLLITNRMLSRAREASA